MPGEIFNPNPTVFLAPKSSRKASSTKESLWVDEDEDQSDLEDGDDVDLIDRDEIYGTTSSSKSLLSGLLNSEADLIRSIYDPEHPNTLEELHVVSAPQISVSSNRVVVEFTPTVPHCGMSTLIGKIFTSSSGLQLTILLSTGLSIRVRLLRSLPNRFKIDIFLKPGSHQSEHAGEHLGETSFRSHVTDSSFV